VATLTGGRTPPDTLTPRRTGFGAGSRDPEDRPNVLRLVACDTAVARESLFLIQADLDDMPAEYVARAQQALLDAGALDAVLAPVTMKKGRPGLRVEVLAPADRLQPLLGTLFIATSTIGARYWPVSRPALDRTEETVLWRGQPIRRKRVRLPDGTERTKPEYEDVLRAAEALELPAWQVRLAVEEALPGEGGDPTSGSGV
jgi:hypothetical protein